MKEYHTAQRAVLAAFFDRHRGEQFTIDELLAALPAEPPISRSAVYRNVDKMVREGLLSKTLGGESRKTLYQHIDCGSCCERIHLRCERCGRLFHMENPSDEARLNELMQNNGLSLNDHATVLLGTCKHCQ